MADTRRVVLLALLAAVGLLMSSFILAVDAGGSGQMGWIRAGSGLDGLDELEFEQEFQMDSEINRRILATTSYISYGALNRNRVPCSRRGASYYNCRPGAQANPYSRGCSAITRCRRS